MGDSKANCKNCLYSAMAEKRLFCRRFPPVQVLVGINPQEDGTVQSSVTTIFLEVPPTHWCGEYQQEAQTRGN